ncbi:unnamed protein product [Caenorhabditis nigoni]|nr:hypothetical protein B9Z55_005550 [Caenorhabditis nigoni]
MNETLLFLSNVSDSCGVSLLDQPSVRYPLMVIYCIVFVVCLVGNLITLAVLTTHPMMKTPTHYFLSNLAAADILVAVFCILQNMVHLIGLDHGNWPLGAFMCRAYLGITNVMPCTSAGILVLVSAEKYIAVLHPLSGLKWLTPENRKRACVAVWVISVGVNVPYFINAEYFEMGDQAACFRIAIPMWNIFSFVIWYLIPLICLTIIYSRISHLLWTSDSTRQSSRQSHDSKGDLENGNGTTSAPTPGASWQMKNGKVVMFNQESLLKVPIKKKESKKESKKPKDTEGRRKVVRLLVAVVVAFAVLTLPHHARILYTSFETEPFCNSDWMMLTQPLSYILLFMSSAINPILYACLSKRFRTALSDVLHCRKGIFHKISRPRTRTLVSDVPVDDTPCPSPLPQIRMNRIR